LRTIRDRAKGGDGWVFESDCPALWMQPKKNTLRRGRYKVQLNVPVRPATAQVSLCPTPFRPSAGSHRTPPETSDPRGSAVQAYPLCPECTVQTCASESRCVRESSRAP